MLIYKQQYLAKQVEVFARDNEFRFEIQCGEEYGVRKVLDSVKMDGPATILGVRTLLSLEETSFQTCLTSM